MPKEKAGNMKRSNGEQPAAEEKVKINTNDAQPHDDGIKKSYIMSVMFH